MNFSSLEFVVLFGLLLAVLASLRNESRRRDALVIASYGFYGWWDWRFCGLILASSIIDYHIALRMSAATEPRARRRWLMSSVVINLGVLAFFKYANFFIDSVDALGLDLPHADIILPVGISFFTFQTMSYTIDVYRRRLEPTRSFRDFALFVAFFPQLVAGPIVRGAEFLPQLSFIHPLRGSNIREGAEIFLRGFTKKLLLADTLAIYADRVFADPASFSSGTCWLAAVAYAGQIYYDFSGYTDMAIGLAHSLGFEFPQNFRHPYISRNVTEFWRRWHISLSSWLRDYLYIPLGGNKLGRGRTYINLMVTMLLGGLWHGASWTFVVWGALHGIALAVHKWFLERSPGRAPRPPSPIGAVVSWAATMLFVLVCWVFFRAQDFSTAFTMLARMVGSGGRGMSWFHVPSMIVLAIAALLHLDIARRRGDERPIALDLRSPFQAALAVMVLIAILLFAPVEVNPFIYFQF